MASRIVWILRWCHRGRHHNTLRCSPDQVRKSAIQTFASDSNPCCMYLFACCTICCPTLSYRVQWWQVGCLRGHTVTRLTLTLYIIQTNARYQRKQVRVIRTLKSIAAEEGLAGKYEFWSEVQVHCTVRGSVSLRVPISLVWMIHPVLSVALLPGSTLKFITLTFLGLFSGLTPRMIWISVGGFLFFGAYSCVKVPEDPRL